MKGNTMVADTERGALNNNTMASETVSVANFSIIKKKEAIEDALPSVPPTNGRIESSGVLAENEDTRHHHHSSDEDDDEDKLVINEEKKEALSEARALIENAKSPKSIMKRPVDEEEDAPMSPKKPRLDEVSPRDKTVSIAQVQDSLSVLKKDLEGLEVLLKQKEEEWNALLCLQKKKEEAYIQLLRKKQVSRLQNIGREDLSKEDDEVDDRLKSVVFLPDGCYSSMGGSQIPAMMMRHFLGGINVPQITASNCDSKISLNGTHPSIHSNVSVIDIHTSNNKPLTLRDPPQISISPELHSKSGKPQSHSMSSMKPILPKPISVSDNLLNSGPLGSAQVSLGPTGYGPQGPTVSVHQLIAAHRKDNPNIPPIRGAKRGAWRYRYDSDTKRSSSREPDRPSSVSSSNSETDVRGNTPLSSKGNSSSANNLLPMNDPSVSYKDVLLQFAQMTQTEKQPGSPQISIIPVGSSDGNRKPEPIPDSTSVSREMPMSSQGHNLESSSALAKLLMESGASGQGGNSKSPSIDLLSCNSSSPQYLTLSALLSGGTTTTVKDKSSSSQVESRMKKGSDEVTPPNTNPKCQGCHKNRAQFVCAGCGNQWYCSRECQVAAWEEHSELCNN